MLGGLRTLGGGYVLGVFHGWRARMRIAARASEQIPAERSSPGLRIALRTRDEHQNIACPPGLAGVRPAEATPPSPSDPRAHSCAAFARSPEARRWRWR
jgi:hypothetical protein